MTSAIVERLYSRFVSLPSGAGLDDALRAFKDRCYPQCAGAIGGTHIPIAPPRDNPDHYLNKRGWHSVILQAVVDHRVWLVSRFRKLHNVLLWTNQTPLTKSVILVNITQELPIYHRLDLLVCLCYCVTSVDPN